MARDFTTGEFRPFDFLTLVGNAESGMPPLMILCRAPADDGWLAIEAETALIYNIFDTVSHHYAVMPPTVSQRNVSMCTHRDFQSRAAQSRLLARARWFHAPGGYNTLSCPVSA